MLVLSQEISMVIGCGRFLSKIRHCMLKETDLAGIHIVTTLIQQPLGFVAREISQGASMLQGIQTLGLIQGLPENGQPTCVGPFTEFYQTCTIVHVVNGMDTTPVRLRGHEIFDPINVLI